MWRRQHAQAIVMPTQVSGPVGVLHKHSSVCQAWYKAVFVLHYLLSHCQCRATTCLKLSRTTPTTHTTHPETHDPCGYTPNAHRRLTDWPPTHAVPCAMIETLAAWPGNRASWHHAHRPHTHTDTHAERWPAAGCVSSAGHIWMTTGDHGANWHRRTDLTRPPHATPRPTRALSRLDTWRLTSPAALHSRRPSDTTSTSTETDIRPT